jgi:hypothetical protein
MDQARLSPARRMAQIAMSDLFGSRKVDMYCVGIEMLTGR